MENILYTFPPQDGLLSSSPFCAKVEMFLRFNNLPYKTVMANPMKSKKGKLPTLKDTDGVMVEDSRFIIKHLIKKHNLTIDDHLDAQAQAKGHMMQRLCEESLYFSSLYYVFIDDTGFAQVKARFSKTMPPVLGLIIIPMIRKSIRKALHGQGTGRHTPQEILQLGYADLDALAALIGSGPFALGEKVSSYDASIGAFIAAAIIPDSDHPLSVYAKSKKELVAYNAKLQALVQSKTQAAPVK